MWESWPLNMDQATEFLSNIRIRYSDFPLVSHLQR